MSNLDVPMPNAGEKTVNIPGIGNVTIVTKSAVSLSSVTGDTKVYRIYSNVTQILSTITTTPEAYNDALITRRRVVLQDSIATFVYHVSEAIGKMMVASGVATGDTPATLELGDIPHEPHANWDSYKGHCIRWFFLQVMCGIVKPVTDVNKDYLLKRYKAFCAKINVSEPTNLGYLDCPNWVATTSKNRDFLSKVCAYLEENEETDHQLTALLEQVKLVWRGYGLAVTNIMYEFVLGCNSEIITKAPILREAAQFKTIYEKTKEKLGNYFQYAKILNLPDVDALNHAVYPSLYIAASKWGKSIGALTVNIQLSTGIRSTIPDRVMDLALREELPEGSRRLGSGEDIREAAETIGLDLEKALPKTINLSEQIALALSQAGIQAPGSKRPRIN